MAYLWVNRAPERTQAASRHLQLALRVAKDFQTKLILISSNWKHVTQGYHKGSKDQMSLFLQDWESLLWIMQVVSLKPDVPDRKLPITTQYWSICFSSLLSLFAYSELRSRHKTQRQTEFYRTAQTQSAAVTPSSASHMLTTANKKWTFRNNEEIIFTWLTY